MVWCDVALLAMNFVLMLLVFKRKAFSRSQNGGKAGQDDLYSSSDELSQSQREIRHDIRKTHQSIT